MVTTSEEDFRLLNQLVDSGRHVVREGRLCKVQAGGQSGISRMVQVWLFDDLIVYGRPLIGTGKVHLERFVPLQRTQVINFLPPTSSSPFANPCGRCLGRLSKRRVPRIVQLHLICLAGLTDLAGSLLACCKQVTLPGGAKKGDGLAIEIRQQRGCCLTLLVKDETARQAWYLDLLACKRCRRTDPLLPPPQATTHSHSHDMMMAIGGERANEREIYVNTRLPLVP